MSIIHNILPKKSLDISKLNDFVSAIDNAFVKDKGGGVYYYWIEGKSTRGFDITIEGDTIEVRNTILSNKSDYDLTNKVVKKILDLTNGIILNEDEKQVKTLPLFDDKKISNTEIHDCQIVQILVKKNQDVAILGPKRNVHFGKRLHKILKPYSGKKLCEAMFSIIIKVNYQIPNFEYGSILHVGKSQDNMKTMKLLTNKTDYVIDKYDFILLHTSDKKPPIMITNEILNTILPSNWTLIDEFTVVAPITSKDEWDKLLNRAKQYNQFDIYKS